MRFDHTRPLADRSLALASLPKPGGALAGEEMDIDSSTPTVFQIESMRNNPRVKMNTFRHSRTADTECGFFLFSSYNRAARRPVDQWRLESRRFVERHGRVTLSSGRSIAPRREFEFTAGFAPQPAPARVMNGSQSARRPMAGFHLPAR